MAILEQYTQDISIEWRFGELGQWIVVFHIKANICIFGSLFGFFGIQHSVVFFCVCV